MLDLDLLEDEEAVVPKKHSRPPEVDSGLPDATFDFLDFPIGIESRKVVELTDGGKSRPGPQILRCLRTNFLQ